MSDMPPLSKAPLWLILDMAYPATFYRYNITAGDIKVKNIESLLQHMKTVSHYVTLFVGTICQLF